MAQIIPYTGVPSVSPESRPPDDYQHINASPESFGAAVGRGLEQFGAGASKAGHFFGQVAADDATNQFQDFTTKLLHGDATKMVTGPDGQQTPDRGYLALKGRAALDQRPAVEQQIDARLKEIRAGLQTPEQQLQFDNVSRRYRSGVSERVGNHADQQSNVWFSEVNNSTFDVSRNHIAVNPDDPVAFAHGASDMINAAAKNAELKGAVPGDPVWTQAVEGAKREALKTQVQAIGVSNPVRALELLEKNKEIAGAEYTPLANALRVRSQRQAGDTAGAKAIATSSSRFTPAVGDAIARAAGRYGLDPEVLRRFAIIESSGEPGPKSNTGSYKGLFQLSVDEFSKRGGKDIYDPYDNANVAAAKLKDEAAAFEAKYGRSATPSDLYMIHQQGAGGYAAHLANPNALAWQNMASTAEGRQKGEGWAKQAIWRNIPDTMKARFGSVDNVTSQDFTRMWAGIVNGGATAVIKADAYQQVLDDPSLDHEARSHALAYINQTLQAQQIASAENEKAKKEANDHAANGFVTRMLKGDMRGITEQIANDPNLTWQTRERLSEIAEKQSGADVEKAARSFGPGFWGAYKAITAPAEDPARISDPADLLKRAGPDGDLTLSGVEKLTKTLQEIKKDTNSATINHSKVGLLNYAKSKLSYEGELTQTLINAGLPARRDPRGEAIFNGVFIPKFEAAFDEWVKGGKNPWEFLNKENVDKMLGGMRSKAQMDMDRVSGDADAANAPGSKAKVDMSVPPAPEGIKPEIWAGVMKTRPVLAGKIISPRAWATVINDLREDPTPENIAEFKRAFPSFDGDTLIQQLGNKPAPAAPAPTAPAPNEPDAPPLPTAADTKAGWRPQMPGIFGAVGRAASSPTKPAPVVPLE